MWVEALEIWQAGRWVVDEGQLLAGTVSRLGGWIFPFS